MSPDLVGIVGTIVMLVLMFLGIPVMVCMSLVAIAGIFIIRGPMAFVLAGATPFTTLSSYNLALLPIFLIMGEFADYSGMVQDSYRAGYVWMGSLRGGLAMASLVGAALFSAVSGSSMACAALMTRVSLPSLLDYKYKPRLVTGVLAAGGTLGNLIPPGIGIVYYAMITDTSIGKLFMAVTIPGVLLLFMYIIQIYIQCRLDPSLGPPGKRTTPKQKLLAFKDAAPTTVVFMIVMGGIWKGIFTPTEAASIGTLCVFLYALIKRTVNGQRLIEALKNSLVTTGMALAIIIAANLYTYFIVVSGLSRALGSWISALGVPTVGVIICIMIIYLILGTALDTLSMIFITLPFFIPLLTALHVDLIWFGVLVIIHMELSSLSPPVGLNLFVVAVMVKDRGISMGTIFRGVTPFCVTMCILNAIIIIFPQVAMWLPNTMR